MKWILKDLFYLDRDGLLESLDAEMVGMNCGMCDRVIALNCILSEVKEEHTVVLVIYLDGNVEVYADGAEVYATGAEYLKIVPQLAVVKVYQMES